MTSGEAGDAARVVVEVAGAGDAGFRVAAVVVAAGAAVVVAATGRNDDCRLTIFDLKMSVAV